MPAQSQSKRRGKSARKVAPPSRGFPRQALAERVTQLLDRLPDETIAEALGQSDAGTLATLASPEAWGEQYATATDRARLRGAAYRRGLLERAGGALSVEGAAETLGVSSEAVRKRLRKGSLLGIKTGGGYLIPAVQFAEGAELPGLRRVLQAMSVESPWMRLDWLISPEPRLGDKTPVNALAAGDDIDDIVAAASLVGEHGAA